MWLFFKISANIGKECKLNLPLANTLANGTERFKILNKYLNANIYSYIETSGGQSSNLYLNVVNFFNTSVN